MGWSKQLEGWETVTVYSPKLDTQHGKWEFAVRGHSSAAVKRGVIIDDRRLSIDRVMDKLLAAYPGMAQQSEPVVFTEANRRSSDYSKGNYPYFVCHHGNWDIYSNDRGYCASIPTEAAAANGCRASHFGDAGYVKATLGVTVKTPNEQAGGRVWYGVLKDCTHENLSFLASFDGLVIGHADTENERFRHVKLTADALERVREFPADFVFEVLADENAREPNANVSAMSTEALVAEAACLGWMLHAPEEEAPVQAVREAAHSRRTAVVAEALKRVKEAAATASPPSAPTAGLEMPAI